MRNESPALPLPMTRASKPVDPLTRLMRLLLLGALMHGASAWAALPIQQWTTTQGMHVLFVEEHTLPMLDVQLDVHAGTASDPAGREGLAALVAENLNDGTPLHDEDALARLFADLGAVYGVHSDIDRSGVNLRTLSAPATRAAALDGLVEILQTPLFPAAAFERERKRALSALQESLAQPAGLAERAFYPRLFPAHGYGAVVSAASLERITRDDLAAFYAQHWHAARSVLTLVGDLSRADAEALAERLGAALPAGPAVADPSAPTMPPVSGELHIAHPAAQAHILLGQPAFAYGDPDYVPLMVANYVLGGGGFSSRLTDEVREKRGLTYGVTSQFTPLQSAGTFTIGLETRRDQAGQALALVRKVLDDFVLQGPTAAELRDAKQYLVGSFPLRLDSNHKQLDFVANIGFHQLPLDWASAYPRAIQQVTLAQVRDAVRRRLHPEQMVTVVVGGEAR